jgi:hypothetical protein
MKPNMANKRRLPAGVKNASQRARLPANNKTVLPRQWVSRCSEPPPPCQHSRHHTKDKQRFVVSVVAYDSIPGHHQLSCYRTARTPT